MPAEKAVADARPESARTPPALLRGRLGLPDRHQPVHAAGRVVADHAGKPAVDHHAHPFDGQARFGDVGGQDDLPLPAGQDRLFLFGKREIAIQGVNGDPGSGFLQKQFMAGTDLSRTGEECQDVAARLGQRRAHCGGHPFRQAAVTGILQIADLHGEGPSFRSHDRRIAQDGCHGSAIHGR